MLRSFLNAAARGAAAAALVAAAAGASAQGGDAAAPPAGAGVPAAAAAAAPGAPAVSPGVAPVAPAAPEAASAASAAAAASPSATQSAGGPRSANILDRPEANDAAAQAERQRTQPLNNAPVWREAASGKEHYTSIKGRETGVLIQAGGERWRWWRNGPFTQWGGWALVLAIVGVSAFYAVRGPLRNHDAPTGRTIERFTPVERTAHWSLAISFAVLAVTGLAMLFGKHVLLPVIGYRLFSWLAVFSKTVHNFVGPLFAVSVVFAFLVYVRDNWPNRKDLVWVAKGGGLFTGEHVPSHKFNAGEKSWFWLGVFWMGITVAVTGFVLDFPNFDQTRGQMQLAWMFHAGAALVFMLMSIGHIYMGTVGVEGAYQAMRTGYVDEAWAKEHHEWWYDDVKAGKIPSHRSRDSQAAAGTTAAARPSTAA